MAEDKPTIYNAPTIYKTGAEGGGGTSIVPGVYLLGSIPDNSFGEDGEYAIIVIKTANVDGGTIIPVQTNDNNCSSSAVYPGYYTYYLYDGNLMTFWSTPDYQTTGWNYYDFGNNNKKKIVSLSIYPRVYDNYRQIKNFQFQGSDDAIAWTTLIEASIPDGTTEDWFQYVFSNNSYYRYYRLNVLSTNGGTVTVKEVHMSDIIDDSTEFGIITSTMKKVSGVWVYV